jgi:ketosteroid isomerase-like protein
MAREDIERLRAGYDALRRGDPAGVVAFLDPEIVATDHDEVLDTPKEYRGHQGVLRMATENAEGFDEHRYETEEFTEAVSGRVIVAVRRRGRGSRSGVEIDERQWHVWDIREGQGVRLQVFVREDAAREAAESPA